MTFVCRLLVLLIATGVCPLVASAEQDSAPHEKYRVLEWKDLVPDEWEPPIVSTAYDEVADGSVDEASIVGELDQQLSALAGYLRPVVFTGNQVTEFLLVPFLPHQITAHAHLDPNQMVYVTTLKPVVVDKPFEPIWVVGTFSTEPVMTDEGPVAYRMVEAVTTEYEY